MSCLFTLLNISTIVYSPTTIYVTASRSQLETSYNESFSPEFHLILTFITVFVVATTVVRIQDRETQPRVEQSPGVPRGADAELGEMGVRNPRAAQEVTHMAGYIPHAGNGGEGT